MIGTTNPAKDTILFDGQCRFCQAHMRTVQRADRGHRFACVSLHDPEAAQWTSDIPPAQVMREMYVVTRSGRRYGGIDAVRYVTRSLPLLWPVALILHIPGTRRIWGWLYRKVAARRYWFGRASCDTGTCSLE